MSRCRVCGNCGDCRLSIAFQRKPYRKLSYNRKEKGHTVPVLVWQISARDEKYLDRYEGCPTFYYKKKMKVSMNSLIDGHELGEVEAIVYIMHEERQLGCPSPYYYEVCSEGYRRFGFDKRILKKALIDSAGKRKANFFLQEAGVYE